ncbi:DUF488 family protein [Thalassospira permensis]|uniref:DUF488 domain-containing protein n=1 Tax=Thalassospira permensis NBRC 106175 TaxID=1353532 RepID=A0ABR4TLQ9_9PROT|nr:DUF488 domain-containing protein [Thalassospira permensis]KEO55340.1 hypothetical protein SMB34_19415 [Thalassospira permensis NBRC 106175]
MSFFGKMHDNQDNDYPQNIIWTVGYAGHDRDSLLALLKGQDITAVADIRTFRGSNYWKAFDADTFAPFLRENGIAYVFMGDLLGGKPQDPTLYPNGRLDYDLMAARPEFRAGIDRLISGAGKYRICLMCAEKDPLDCHRTLLIAPALKAAGFDLRHLVSDGRVETQAETEKRMIAINGGDTADLFAASAPDPDADLVLALKKQIVKAAPLADDAIKSRKRQNNF